MNNTKITTQSQNNLSLEKVELIKKHFFPKNTSEIEMQYCFNIARQYDLDPVLKQIFFVPRSSKDDKGNWTNKVEPLVGRDGFLAIAHKTGKFGGIKSETEVKIVPKLINGEWQNVKDLVATCEVYRTDATKPFVVQVFYNEYVQKTKEGKITNFWATKPDTMLKKVAKSQALRKAFNLSGLYSPEEVGVGEVDSQSNTLVIDTEALTNTVDASAENKKSFEDEKRAISAFGLSLEEKDGFVKIVGNTYNYTQEIKKLGYQFEAEKKIWWKKLA